MNVYSVWRTREAGQLRRSIKAGECYCSLANAAYTNVLMHGLTVGKLMTDVARSHTAPRARRAVAGEPSA